MTQSLRLYPKIGGGIPDDTSKASVWVALEKIHGAQMVIGVTEDEIRFGKRKAWLQATEPFFGFQLLRSEMEAQARSLHRALGISKAVVSIYGELFGGAYPHPDVPAMAGMAPVQTGIWYAPGLHYAVFDVHVATEPGADGEMLSHAELESLAGEASFRTVPLIRRGPRAALESLPVRFPTHVPATLDLPPIQDNWAEGLILKADARGREDARPILKRKIPEFNEAVFDESAPWNPEQPLSFEQLLFWTSRLVNPPRVASARSKCGDGDPAALLDEIGLDVLVDLEMAFPRAMKELSPEQEEALRRRVMEIATSILPDAAAPGDPAGAQSR